MLTALRSARLNGVPFERKVRERICYLTYKIREVNENVATFELYVGPASNKILQFSTEALCQICSGRNFIAAWITSLDKSLCDIFMLNKHQESGGHDGLSEQSTL